MTAQIALTVDELVATLQRSSWPTLLVEGDNDIMVFRRLEEEFARIGLSVLPAGGRKNILGVFARRRELPSGRVVAFIADRDTWVMSGIPDEYVSCCLIFTEGYSIENDLFVDGRLDRLMYAHERIRFDEELTRFCKWYALALSRQLNDESEPLDLHPNKVLENSKRFQELTMLREDEPYPQEILRAVRGDHAALLRGKSLLALLVRQLSYKGRAARHNERSLLEIAANSNGPLLERIVIRVRSRCDGIQEL